MAAARDFLNQGWIGVTLSAVFFLMSTVVAYALYRRSVMGPKPVCQRQALTLISETAILLPKEVQVLFQDLPVPRLTRNRFIIWNAGIAPLDGQNLVEGDPVRVETQPGSRILKATVVTANNVFSNIQVHADSAPNRWLLSFDYLNPGDGAVIEIIHTDSKEYGVLSGSIRGVPDGIRDLGPMIGSTGTTRFQTPKMLSMLAMLLLMPVYGILDALDKRPHWVSNVFSFVVLMALIFSGLDSLVRRRHYPKSLDSPGLQVNL